MKAIFTSFFLLFLLCKIFILNETTEQEIQQWLVGKKLISITQSSWGWGGGWGSSSTTYITIIAEELDR